MTYKEKRFPTAFPYLVLVAIFALGLCISEIGSLTTTIHNLCVALGLIALVAAIRKVQCPRDVLKISASEIGLKGLRPGWWKWFQLWEEVTILVVSVQKVEIGRVADGLASGRGYVAGLDASRNAVFQRVCVFFYTDDHGSQCMYYPNVDLIENFDSAVVELKTILGSRVEMFSAKLRTSEK